MLKAVNRQDGLSSLFYMMAHYAVVSWEHSGRSG